MTTERATNHSGLFASLGQLGARLVNMTYTRVQLLALEIEEERRHFLAMLVLILVAMFCLSCAVALLTTLLIVACWDAHRLLVLLALAAGYGLAGLTAVWWTTHKMGSKAPPFATSLTQLREDGRQLDGET
jgi:uncharacterized membrane protein YqjE